MTLKKLFAAAAVFLCGTGATQAQVGAKISLLRPSGNMAPYFKPSPAYNLYSFLDLRSARLKLGGTYCNYRPQNDFVSRRYVHMTDGTSGGIIPIREKYDKNCILVLYVESDFRIARYKNVTLNLGVGSSYGWGWYKDYAVKYDLFLKDTVKSGRYGDMSLLRMNASIGYYCTPHIQLFIQSALNTSFGSSGDEKGPITDIMYFQHSIGVDFKFNKFSDYKEKTPQ